MVTYKLLVVEDDDWYGNFLKYHLSQNPEYEVSHAKTGQEALAMLSERKPDVVTLDYAIPDVNGDALLKKIKEV